MGFDGFISYSHAADGRLAPAIQRGLHRLAKPWHRRRALWVFRDQTGLSVTPGLWSSIQRALDGSDYFVLLASPEAARSTWVNREIEHWVAAKSTDRILPVVTDGLWAWDPVLGDFAEDCTAVPAALRRVFAEEPLYLDLRWARDETQLSLRHSRFRDAIAQLAAPMHGLSKDELEGEDVRQHRRARRLQSTAVAALVLLTLAAVLTGLLAARNAARANAAAAEARHQQQSAAEQHSSAERSAAEARRQQEAARQEQARARDSAAEARRQQVLALEQKGVAGRAAAEAVRQQANAQRQRELANQAAARARQQKQFAQRQQVLATRWAERARFQEQLAQKQEKRAQQATEEARRQQGNAADQQAVAVGRRLVNQAKAVVEEDPKTSVMLDVAADRLQHDAETRAALVDMATSTRYAGAVNSAKTVAYSAKGILATGSGDGIISLWNVADRLHPVQLSTLPGKSWLVGDRAFSPDGQILAVIDYRYIIGSESTLTLWNVANPADPVRISTLPDLDTVSSLAFDSDGRTLVVGTNFALATPPETDGLDPTQPVPPLWVSAATTLWNVADPSSPKLLSTLPVEDDSNFVDDVAISPDGGTVVIADGDKMMGVWDITDRINPIRLPPMADDYWSGPMVFAGNRPILAIGNGDGTTTLWDMVHPEKPLRRATLPTETGNTLAFSSDGRNLVTNSWLGPMTLWDVVDPSSPLRLDNITGNIGAVGSIALSLDGRTLAAADGDTVTLWNAAAYDAPEPVGDLIGKAKMKATAFTLDGRSMIIAESAGTASVWDVGNAGRLVRRAALKIHGGDVAAVAFGADARIVAAADWDGRVTLTDLADPMQPATLSTFQVPLFRVPPDSPKGLPPEEVEAITLTRDARTAVVVSTLKVTVWDLTDPRRPSQIFSGHAGFGAFSPDGRTIAAKSNSGVELWDFADPSAPARVLDLPGSASPLDAMAPGAFSPDGRTLVTAGISNRTVVLWNMTDRSHPRRVATLTGLGGAALTAAFSPDGRTLAVGTDDHAVTMWDVADLTTPLRIAHLKRSDLDAATVVFSPDGHTLATGVTAGKDSAIRLWDYRGLNDLRADPAKHACGITGRGLTAEEWAEFIPEVRYQPTCTG